MQVEITCRHGSISGHLNEYIHAKSEKLLTFFERVTAIVVTFDFAGPRVKAEILVDAEHKHNFVAHDEGEDAQLTFDSALHKMEKQINKYKEKVQDHRRDIPLRDLNPEPSDEDE